MISDNFWKILFVLMLLGGLVFWYKSHRSKAAFNNAASELAALIDFDEESMPHDDAEAQERFIKAITLLYHMEESGMDTSLLLTAAHKNNEVTSDSGHARLIDSSLYESLAHAKNFGIFNDDSIWDLEEGRAVKIVEGPFKGENIAVTYFVPPAIAEGARLFLGNFVLVPESVAAASQDIELTELLHLTSTKLANANIITAGEAKAIKDNFYLQRKRSR